MTQSYSNLEIILVNDGSTDNSGSICERYIDSNPNIKLFTTENGGLSAARNYGLNHVSGEYFTFIDSDDYIRCDYIDLLFDAINRDNSDIAIVSYLKTALDHDTMDIPSETNEYHLYSREEAQLLMVARKLPTYAHGKLYRKELIPLLHFPVGKLYEDIPAIWDLTKDLNKVSFVSAKAYYYRQRPGSIVNSKFAAGRMDQLYFGEQILKELTPDTPIYYAGCSRCFSLLLITTLSLRRIILMRKNILKMP